MGLFLPLLRPHMFKLTIAFVAIVVSALTVLAFGMGIKELVDGGFSSGSEAYLDYALIALFFVVILMALASYTRFFLMHSVAERITAELKKMLYAHILLLDCTYFDKNATGDQVSRINADTALLKTVMTTNFPSAVRHALTMFGSIFMLTVVDPSLTGMVLIVLPFVVIPIIYFGRKVRVKSRYAQFRIGDLSAYSHETIQGLPTIQSFCYEGKAHSRFALLANYGYRAALRYVHIRAFLTAFIIAVVFSAIGVVLWIGGHRVIAGEITVGELSAFVFYAVATAGAVGALSEAMSAFNQAIGAADRITDLLSQMPQLKGMDSDKDFPDEIGGSVSFDNVSFSYPTRKNRVAIEKVSFSINAGEVVAIVGSSGSGKSTVLQLLQRFYDPQGGVIKIDDLNISEYPPYEIRDCMGVVSQDPVIFGRSVSDNIRMGNPDATEAEVIEAAKLAQAHQFIALLPDGYNTQVGEGGGRLSGGQRQRIAIARVMLKNPKILLLDEATSALDASNEKAVMEGLKSLMEGRTTIVVTHSFMNVQDADRIIVMNQGQVVSEISSDDLTEEGKALDPEAVSKFLYSAV